MSILNMFWFTPIYLFYLYRSEGNIQPTNGLRSFLLLQHGSAPSATHIPHSEDTRACTQWAPWHSHLKHKTYAYLGNLMPFDYLSSGTFYCLWKKNLNIASRYSIFEFRPILKLMISYYLLHSMCIFPCILFCLTHLYIVQLWHANLFLIFVKLKLGLIDETCFYMNSKKYFDWYIGI